MIFCWAAAKAKNSIFAEQNKELESSTSLDQLPDWIVLSSAAIAGLALCQGGSSNFEWNWNLGHKAAEIDMNNERILSAEMHIQEPNSLTSPASRRFNCDSKVWTSDFWWHEIWFQWQGMQRLSSRKAAVLAVFVGGAFWNVIRQPPPSLLLSNPELPKGSNFIKIRLIFPFDPPGAQLQSQMREEIIWNILFISGETRPFLEEGSLDPAEAGSVAFPHLQIIVSFLFLSSWAQLSLLLFHPPHPRPIRVGNQSWNSSRIKLFSKILCWQPWETGSKRYSIKDMFNSSAHFQCLEQTKRTSILRATSEDDS